MVILVGRLLDLCIGSLRFPLPQGERMKGRGISKKFSSSTTLTLSLSPSREREKFIPHSRKGKGILSPRKFRLTLFDEGTDRLFMVLSRETLLL